MTVSTATNKAGPFAGAGLPGPFTIPFRFLDASHLRVIRTAADGTETVLALVADYTVTGAGAPSGGTLTLTAALPVGQRLTIIRDVPFTQEADYVNNDAFPAESHETALDKLTMIAQQLAEENDRALALPPSVSGVSSQLPAPAAGYFLGWNASGTGLRNFDPSAVVTVAATSSWRTDVFNGTGAQANFTLSVDPGNANAVDVSVSGVTQVPGDDYTVVGTVLTFTPGNIPPAGTRNVVARYGQALPQNGALAALADTASPSQGAALVGYNPALTYPANSVGAALQGGGSGFATIVQGDGVTNNAAAIVAANALGRPIFFRGISVVGSPVTITVPIVDTMSQIFSAASQITIANNQPVRPEWWGIGNNNALDLAINALPTTGGTVQLEVATYRPNGYFYGTGGVGSGKAITKDNLTIQGRKMPRLSDDCRSLVGGSIIQGMLLAYADNIQIRDLGVDCGKTVLDTFYGGVETPGTTEGLLLTYPDAATKSASARRRGARLHNVIGLCSSPSALVHAVIAGEGIHDVVCTGEVVGCMGVYGVVFKCAAARADSVTAYCNNSTGVIIKTDVQTTALAADITIGKIYSRAQGPFGWSPYLTALGTQQYGILIQPQDGGVDKIQVGQAILTGPIIGIGNSFGGAWTSSSVKFGDVVIDQFGVSGTRQGLQLLAGSTQGILRWNINHLEVRNSTVGVQALWLQPGGNLNQRLHIDHLHVVNSANAVDIGQQSYVSFGAVTTDNLSLGVYHITGTPRMLVGTMFKDSLTSLVYDPTNSGIVPTLINSWVQVASNDPFGVELAGGRIHLRGLVRPGSSNILSTLPNWARPVSNKRFVAQGFNGTTQALVPVIVASDGTVQVNEAAGGFANCSTWLSLSGISYDITA